MISGLQRMKGNLVTALHSFSISFSSHFYQRVVCYQGGTRTKLWGNVHVDSAMFKFSSYTFRVFMHMMTISNKNGFPVTSYGIRPWLQLPDIFIVYLSPFKIILYRFLYSIFKTSEYVSSRKAATLADLKEFLKYLTFAEERPWTESIGW